MFNGIPGSYPLDASSTLPTAVRATSVPWVETTAFGPWKIGQSLREDASGGRSITFNVPSHTEYSILGRSLALLLRGCSQLLRPVRRLKQSLIHSSHPKMKGQEKAGRREYRLASIRQTQLTYPARMQECVVEAPILPQITPQPSLPQSYLGFMIIVICPMGW